MSRLTLAVDRIVTLLIGLVILATGLYALLWWQGRLTNMPARVHTSVLNDVTAHAWWPWAVGVGGVILVAIGLRWLAAHLPRRSLPAFRLPGSAARGRLEIESSAVADAAARELSAMPGVRSVRARLVQDRGQDVLSMRGQIDSDADLVALGHAADAIRACCTGGCPRRPEMPNPARGTSRALDLDRKTGRDINRKGSSS